ncbi:MAG TPA: hypothetical protein GX702_16105 [Chloroflexi bacterium]|jgi:hypothetical protein|nr:hypothetical protein [Chloroflexota bacterium]
MMKTRTYTGLAGRVLFGLILGFLLILILALFPGSVRARPLSLPPRATPTPVPTATPVPVAAESDPRLYGAQITLRLAPDMPGGRAVVRWLDALGIEHDVDGWQGEIVGGGSLSWWVAPQDLGKGPFRWVVYDPSDGTMIHRSDTFMLPAAPQRVLVVELPRDGYVPMEQGVTRLGWPESYIELQARAGDAGRDSVVQWRDSVGNWHDVDGWRSPVPSGDVLGWHVDQGDRGKGPFRWVVYGDEAGTPPAVSALFYLPNSAAATVVTLPSVDDMTVAR